LGLSGFGLATPTCPLCFFSSAERVASVPRSRRAAAAAALPPTPEQVEPGEQIAWRAARILDGEPPTLLELALPQMDEQPDAAAIEPGHAAQINDKIPSALGKPDQCRALIPRALGVHLELDVYTHLLPSYAIYRSGA
jgi:hypothetical protein